MNHFLTSPQSGRMLGVRSERSNICSHFHHTNDRCVMAVVGVVVVVVVVAGVVVVVVVVAGVVVVVDDVVVAGVVDIDDGSEMRMEKEKQH
jgi:hypothetical protein